MKNPETAAPGPTRFPRILAGAFAATACVLFMNAAPLTTAAASSGEPLRAAAAAPGEIRAVELRCEHRDDPPGIREVWPRLTWRLEAARPGRRGLVQTAWQILVASSPEKLAAGEGDLWDSGRVESAGTRAVFAGRKLAALQQAWWKVRVWDGAATASDWSAPATWSRGLEETVTLKDWPGDWIGLDPDDGRHNETLTDAQRAARRQLKWVKAVMSGVKKRPVPAFDAKVAAPPTDTDMGAGRPLTAWFAKTFRVDDKAAPARAVIWLVPDMECEIWLNDHRAGTAARWEIARQIDLAPFLRDGDNRVALRVTQNDGYAPAVLGEIELFPAAGTAATAAADTTRRIPLDATWRFAESDAATPPPPAASDTAAAAAIWKKPALLSRVWGTAENVTHHYAPAAMLRKEFAVEKPVRRATLVATAAGIYEIEINGRRVGADFFSPGCTDYRRRIHAQTHDVTALLGAGANAIGITLADGWFAGVMGYSGRRHTYGGWPRARALLVIEHTDGTVARLATDRSWKAAFGPVRYADLMQGCGYDARLETPGWTRPGFDDSGWKRAATGHRTLADGAPNQLAQTVLEGATLDGARITETLPARSVRETAPGVWLADFGQNFTGWARLKTRGGAGARVIFRHGEMLNPDGTLYTSNLRGASAVDEFWLRGDAGGETLEPRFTFHGFRYLEVRGLAQAPAPADFTGVVVHTPMKRTGWFECSDENLNKLFSNIIWGQRGNYLEIPTDCPQRDERLGWTGDTQFFARTASYNYDTRAFLERWLESLVSDAQNAEGVFPGVAPSFPGYHVRPSTAWGDAAIIVPHVLWTQYGETRPIERHYDALARYMDWLDRRSRDGIVLVGGYGDWLHKGGTAKTEVMDTAYHAHLCDLMSQMAEATGRVAEAARYAELRDEVRAAFAREFLRPDGAILESSQTGYALAFTMDLVPDRLRAAMTEKFNDTIRAFDWHLATGFIGTPRLMPALFAAGLDATAWRVLMQDTYPSWLYQVKLGATTMWERWDGWTPGEGFQAVAMNSFNHYAFGAVGEALYRHVAGIDTAAPGFREIVIRPRPGGGLTHARAAYEAAPGRVESGWKLEAGGRFILDVTIPVGARARIHLPAKSAAAVTESGRPLAAAPGVRLLANTPAAPGEIACETGSGEYHFEVRP